jgi:DNA-binding PadR family transcriptional regulator
MNRSVRRSPLALAILGLLFEEPMHPYRMQQLVKARGKDEVINVRLRAGLYQTIDRLLRAGLIAVQETQRAEKRPERSVYALTEKGRAALQSWLRAMLSTQAREFPEFPAAVAHVALLAPEDVLRQLEQRVAALEDEADRSDARYRSAMEILPRVVLLELEYARAVRQAEAAWARSVIDDLRTGRLTWSEESLRPWMGQPRAEPGTTERSAR